MPATDARTIGLGFGAALFAALNGAVAAHAMKLPNAKAEPLTFAALDGWQDDDHAEAFGAFMKSCGAIQHGTKAMRAARPVYGALFKVCERAKAAGSLNRDQARAFFEENFRPVRVAPLNETGQGFYTGYYETEVHGSLVRTDEFSVPIYRKPDNLLMPKNGRGKPARIAGGKKLVPYHDRTEIEQGALAGKGLEICWVKDPVDAFFAQIQGSTRVKLNDGKLMRLNYHAHNGLPYTPVGRNLIDRGIISKEEMSMDRIRAWMQANPEEGRELRRKNRSFVFFRETHLAADEECIGAQGVPLTALRSVAVDRKIHVYGTPIWVDADLPIESEVPDTKFRRLMVAQDTGSAIIGPARADIYFGSGEAIGSVAGRIKQFGQFVMLAPRSLAAGKGGGMKGVPVPKPKPPSKDVVAETAVTSEPQP